MGETEYAKREGQCPACRSRLRRNLGRKGDFEILSCQRCRTIYSSSTAEGSEAQDYDGYYASENLFVPDSINSRLDEIVAGFSAYRVNNRMLEVGFGAGTLLIAAACAGWNVEGVEISKSAIKHCEAQGFKPFRGELSEARYESGSFDLVVLTELLEHLQDPGAMIREVARILRPGGLFWGTTPNSRGLSARLLGLEWSVICPPEHLQLLSEKGAGNLCVEAGFRKVNIVTEGANLFELSKFRRRKRKDGLLPPDASPSVSGCDRVNAGYRLNETLMKSGPRRTAKNFLNSLLRLSHLGDTLKIRAEH